MASSMNRDMKLAVISTTYEEDSLFLVLIASRNEGLGRPSFPFGFGFMEKPFLAFPKSPPFCWFFEEAPAIPSRKDGLGGLSADLSAPGCVFVPVSTLSYCCIMLI